MARPQKDGLDYFPFDVDFMKDTKVRRIARTFGCTGTMAIATTGSPRTAHRRHDTKGRPRGHLKAAEVAKRAGVTKAASLMRADHYGWFDRVALGVYALSPKGLAALGENADELARLGSAGQTLKDSA